MADLTGASDSSSLGASRFLGRATLDLTALVHMRSCRTKGNERQPFISKVRRQGRAHAYLPMTFICSAMQCSAVKEVKVHR